MDGSVEITAQLQQILIPPILVTLRHSLIGRWPAFRYHTLDIDLFVDVLDHALDLVDSLTFNTKAISAEMWPIFEQIYHLFKNSTIDFLEGPYVALLGGYVLIPTQRCSLPSITS